MGRQEGNREARQVSGGQERGEHRRSPRAALGRTDLIRVLAETDGWLAVDKPAGLVAVPAPTSEASLWRILEAERGERLWAVHRIDRGTSGLVVFARNADSHKALSKAFERADVRKTYLAFVHGAPDDGTIDTPLHNARRGQSRPASPGERGAREAATEVRLLERFVGAALVEARPRTGRHHQIRVHLKSVGAPLLVDPIYGRPRSGCAAALPSWRVTLHAQRLEIDGHVVESPLPDDLVALRACLTASAGTPPSSSG